MGYSKLEKATFHKFENWTAKVHKYILKLQLALSQTCFEIAISTDRIDNILTTWGLYWDKSPAAYARRWWGRTVPDGMCARVVYGGRPPFRNSGSHLVDVDVDGGVWDLCVWLWLRLGRALRGAWRLSSHRTISGIVCRRGGGLRPSVLIFESLRVGKRTKQYMIIILIFAENITL